MANRDPHGWTCPTCGAVVGAPCEGGRIHWERRLLVAWQTYPDPWLDRTDD